MVSAFFVQFRTFEERERFLDEVRRHDELRHLEWTADRFVPDVLLAAVDDAFIDVVRSIAGPEAVVVPDFSVSPATR